jgi:hypothetical protein
MCFFSVLFTTISIIGVFAVFFLGTIILQLMDYMTVYSTHDVPSLSEAIMAFTLV